PRLDLLDDLLRAVPCRPPVRDPRPDDRRPRRLERGDLAQQLGGGEFRPRGASRARPALRPRGRFMEVVTGLWDSWEDDALIIDKPSGRFADPDKVHRLDHRGKYFTSKGPLTVPRSAQGHPVLLQAGQSGRGMAFAACWAELVFASYPSLEVGRKNYAYLKGEVEKAGRDPALIKIAPAVKVIVAETTAQAEEQRALTAALAKPIDSMALLCEVLNVDFAKWGYDQPFTDQELAGLSWQSLRDKVIAKTGKKNPSVRDFVEASGRGQLNDGPVFCGTPRQVADE